MNANASLLRSRPRGAPVKLIDEGAPSEIVPAVLAMRKAATALDAVLVLDRVPKRLHVMLMRHIAERPAFYRPGIPEAVAHTIPRGTLLRAVGYHKAALLLAPRDEISPAVAAA